MLGEQARCDSNPVVHPLIVTGPTSGMQRTGFLVRQAVPESQWKWRRNSCICSFFFSRASMWWDRSLPR